MHRILTCRNHPELRWNTKEQSWDNTAGYLHTRTLFFIGIPTGKGMYEDQSGLSCTTVKDGKPVDECNCSYRDLIVAPEDVLVKRG